MNVVAEFSPEPSYLQNATWEKNLNLVKFLYGLPPGSAYQVGSVIGSRLFRVPLDDASVELILELAVIFLGAADAFFGRGQAVALEVPVYVVRRLAADVHVYAETGE